MQTLRPVRRFGLTTTWLALLCVGVLLVAGMVSANAGWHASLHGAGHAHSSEGDSADHPESAQDDASTCLVCALALQQVLDGGALSVEVPSPEVRILGEWIAPETPERGFRSDSTVARGPPDWV